MSNLLKRAGIASQILDLIPEIIETCAACLAWARPAPASVASIEMADTFHEQVEADLVFMHSYVIFT